MLDLTVTYDEVIFAATDYAKVIDCDFEPTVRLRYNMLIRLIAAYNTTCQPCNNNRKLELIGAQGEPFELRFIEKF